MAHGAAAALRLPCTGTEPDALGTKFERTLDRLVKCQIEIDRGITSLAVVGSAHAPEVQVVVLVQQGRETHRLSTTIRDQCFGVWCNMPSQFRPERSGMMKMLFSILRVGRIVQPLERIAHLVKVSDDFEAHARLTCLLDLTIE